MSCKGSQEGQRVECAKKVMCCFEEEGDDFLDSIVTRDETWAHHYTSETKQQSKQETPRRNEVYDRRRGARNGQRIFSQRGH